MPDSLLPSDQLSEFRRRWQPYGLTLEQGLKLRYRARSDLYFLAKDLLGYPDLAECHREVCDFFIHKDPDAPDIQTFGNSYAHVYRDCWGRICIGSHFGLLWLTRGGLKSTIDISDIVQWIVCFPDVRIRILTDILALAQQFVKGAVDHFTLDQEGKPREVNGKPSLFQILFPEFCDTRRTEFASTEIPKWTSPARKNFRLLAPTLQAGSVEGGKTGHHCDVLKFDDAITPENMGTGKSVGTNLNKINSRISMTLNLCDPHGFTEYIGTPQHGLDYNSQVVESERKRMQSGKPPLHRLLIRPVYEVLAGAEGKKPDELQQYEVKEWWPERFTLKQVQDKWAMPSGRDTVATQMLLDVSLKSTVKFTRAILLRATKPWNLVPQDGLKVMAGDLAYSDKPRADLSVLGTATISRGRVYLSAIKRDRVNEDLMPEWIAEEIYRQRPDRVGIENSVGVKWLKRDIRLELIRLGWVGPEIEWVDIGQGQWKRTEVNAEYPSRMMQKGQLIMSTAIAKIEEAYEELENFPSPKHHDDIVAMLNLLCHHFITESELIVGEAEDNERRQLWEQRTLGYGAGSTRQDPGLEDLISTDLPGDL
jgi:phage terminase large subunit-like protein